MGVACGRLHGLLLRGFIVLCALLLASEIGRKEKEKGGATKDAVASVWRFPAMESIACEKTRGLFDFFSSGGGGRSKRRMRTISVPKRIILGSTRFQGRFLGWIPFLGSKGRHGPAKGRARSLFKALKRAGEAWQQQLEYKEYFSANRDEDAEDHEGNVEGEEEEEEEEEKEVGGFDKNFTGQPYVWGLRTWNTVRSLFLKSAPTGQIARRNGDDGFRGPGFNITRFLQCLLAGLQSAIQIYEATSTHESALRGKQIRTFYSSNVPQDESRRRGEGIVVGEEKNYGSAFVITDQIEGQATALQNCIYDQVNTAAFPIPHVARQSQDFPPFKGLSDAKGGGSRAAMANVLRVRIGSEDDFWNLLERLRQLRNPTQGPPSSCKFGTVGKQLQPLVSRLQQGEVSLDVIVYTNGRASVRLEGKLGNDAAGNSRLLMGRRQREHAFWDSLFAAPSQNAGGVKNELAELLFVPETPGLEESLVASPVEVLWPRKDASRTKLPFSNSNGANRSFHKT